MATLCDKAAKAFLDYQERHAVPEKLPDLVLVENTSIDQAAFKTHVIKNLPSWCEKISFIARCSQQCKEYVIHLDFLKKHPIESEKLRRTVFLIFLVAICVLGGAFTAFMAASAIAGSLGTLGTVVSLSVGAFMGANVIKPMMKCQDYFLYRLVSSRAQHGFLKNKVERYLQINSHHAVDFVKGFPDSLFQTNPT